MRGGEVRGTASVPDGSIVEVFSDPGDEGAVFLGDTTVTGGTFELNPGWLPYTFITATVTDLNGNTSPFATAADVSEISTIHIAREGAIEERSIGNSGNPVASMVVEITGGGIPAALESLKFDVSGNIDVAADVATIALHQDLDGDSRLGDADPVVNAEASIDPANATLSFENMNLVVVPGETVRLLPVVALNESAQIGDSFSLTLSDSASAGFTSILAGTDVPETGSYPIASDALSVVEDYLLDSFGQWLLTFLTPEQLEDPVLRNPDGDPDGDSIPTLIEFVFNTNPFESSSFPDIFAQALENNVFEVQFRHLSIPGDLSAEFIGTHDLSVWQDISAYSEFVGLTTAPSPTGGDTITIQLAYPGNGAPLLLKLAVERP
jgi:hypothetical protein